VAHDDDQRRVQVFHAVFDASYSHRVGDGTGHAYHEERAETLMKDVFGRDSRIRARQDDREWVLRRYQFTPANLRNRSYAGAATHIRPIAIAQPRENSFRAGLVSNLPGQAERSEQRCGRTDPRYWS
jgi:hypothetical protein